MPKAGKQKMLPPISCPQGRTDEIAVTHHIVHKILSLSDSSQLRAPSAKNLSRQAVHQRLDAMFFARRVDVFGIPLVVDHRWQGANEMLAVSADNQTGIPVSLERRPPHRPVPAVSAGRGRSSGRKLDPPRPTLAEVWPSIREGFVLKSKFPV